MNKIGIYNIRGEIGRGGMGIVYRGFHPKLQREVAIKILPEALFDDDDLKRRFLQEARLAAGLNHENITTIYDLGEDQDGRSFIVMEFLKGTDLRGYIRQYQRAGKEMPILEKLEIAKQVCNGLAFAHIHNIVHRDIKPENVFVLEIKRIKILDFGIAKPLGETSLNMTRGLIGSVNYMSPELFEGKAIDTRSDIFSFGIMLYELIADQKPFKGTMATVMKQIISGAPEEMDPEKLQNTPKLKEIIFKCLEKNPDHRYQSISEAADALDQIIIDARTRQRRLKNLVFDVRSHVKNKDFGKAEALMREATLIDPNNPKAKALNEEILKEKVRWSNELKSILEKANALVQAGKFPEALNRIEIVLNHEPRQKEALALKKQAEKGIVAAEKSAEVQSQLKTARKHLRQNQFEPARKIVQTILNRMPGQSQAKDLAEEIEKEVERFIRKKTDTAQQYIDKVRYDKAIGVLQELLKALPDYKEAERMIGQLTYRQEHQEKTAHQQKAIAEKVRNAEKLFKKGRLKQATLILDTILAAHPNHPDALRLMSEVQEAIPGPEDQTVMYTPEELRKLAGGGSKRKWLTPLLLILATVGLLASVFVLKPDLLDTIAEVFESDPEKTYQITSDPSGAQLVLNQKNMGPTPQSRTFEIGEVVKVQLNHAEYFPIDTTIIISAAHGDRLAFNLRPLATVSIVVNPSDATITLDGKRRFSEDLRNIKLAAGEHQISVRKTGYYAKNAKFTLNKGKNATLRYNLERMQEDRPVISGTLRIRSTPDGAAIFLNGENTNHRTPHTFSGLETGNYQIELRKEGHEPYFARKNITSATPEPVNADLQAIQQAVIDTPDVTPPPSEGTVGIEVIPYGTISINNVVKKTNYPRRYEEKLPPGDHKISIRHPSYGRWEKTITVPPGGSEEILVDFNVFVSFSVIAYTESGESLSGCDIYVDGEKTKKRTPHELRRRTGIHTVAVRQAGYRMVGNPQTINLEKRSGKPLILQFTMQETP